MGRTAWAVMHCTRSSRRASSAPPAPPQGAISMGMVTGESAVSFTSITNAIGKLEDRFLGQNRGGLGVDLGARHHAVVVFCEEVGGHLLLVL